MSNERLKVSITIPARNEEKYIVRCLDSILNSNYDPSLFKVFVCDGKSDDRTPELVVNYSKKHPQVELLINERKTTPFALNLGLKREGFDVKMILGAHAEIHADYIKNCVDILQNHPEVGCVGGVLENSYEDEASASIGKGMSSPFGVGNAHFRTGGKEGYVDTVAFGAYRDEVFEKIGYFDEDLVRNQDDEYNFRLLKAGFKIYLSNDIRARYYVRASLNKLFRQYYQYGYWKVYVNQKHKTITTLRQLIPAFFVSFLTLGLLASVLIHLLWIPYAFVLLLYLTGAFYFAMKLERRPGAWWKIVQTFVILHWAYGWGYLEGIVQFLVLRKKPKSASSTLTR